MKLKIKKIHFQTGHNILNAIVCFEYLWSSFQEEVRVLHVHSSTPLLVKINTYQMATGTTGDGPQNLKSDRWYEDNKK